MSNTVVKVILPECSGDPISDWLRGLTREIAISTKSETDYGLGGRFGYGENFENDVFMMHRFCWCEKDECRWCNGTAPNFLHKKTNASISWYKYIGRSMEVDEANWSEIFKECFLSIAKQEEHHE